MGIYSFFIQIGDVYLIITMGMIVTLGSVIILILKLVQGKKQGKYLYIFDQDDYKGQIITVICAVIFLSAAVIYSFFENK